MVALLNGQPQASADDSVPDAINRSLTRRTNSCSCRATGATIRWDATAASAGRVSGKPAMICFHGCLSTFHAAFAALHRRVHNDLAVAQRRSKQGLRRRTACSPKSTQSLCGHVPSFRGDHVIGPLGQKVHGNPVALRGVQSQSIHRYRAHLECGSSPYFLELGVFVFAAPHDRVLRSPQPWMPADLERLTRRGAPRRYL